MASQTGVRIETAAVGVSASAVTLAHNVMSPEEVDAVVAAAKVAGISVTRELSPTSRGGYFGCFADPDGYL